ncbi:MAG TPA: glycoside hydrolase family 20 zincin-like fold domain-containing protein [Planctomycetota bacterium]|jgi:hypothetical protein
MPQTIERCKAPRLLALVALAFCAVCSAEEGFNFRTKYARQYDPGNTAIICTRMEQAPKLDGTLNHPIWQQAGKTASAFTSFPVKEPCGRQTVVYACYDDKNLYLAFDCEETELDQQQIDNKNILAGDHVGVHLEIGGTRGRGPRCSIMGNRAGHTFGEGNLTYKCAAGPNRWFVQMGIPFKNLPGAPSTPLRGEVWGVKFTRYGKSTDTGAARMRSSWPHIPTISEDVIIYNAALCFGADNMLENGQLEAKDGKLPAWEVSGQPKFTANGIEAANDVLLAQALKLRGNSSFTLEASSTAGWQGTLAVSAGGTELGSRTLEGGRTAGVPPARGNAGGTPAVQRLDFRLPKDKDAVTVKVTLRGSGKAPGLKLSSLLDDVPAEWICLTNNDWIPSRNLKNRVPNAPEGCYTWLRTPMQEFDYCFYTKRGCARPDQKELNWEQSCIGRPTRMPLEEPPARPDIGEDEYEHTPFETSYVDRYIPEFVGLPLGHFDSGGVQGSIPFSKGSVTGDESWAGWPVDRWSRAVAHDLLFDLKDKYYIRRVDIQQINTGFRNLDIRVRESDDPKRMFNTIYRLNGPGTDRQIGSGFSVYLSATDLDSVAQQVRLSLGVAGLYGNGAAVSAPNLGRPNAQVGLFGIAEVWIWGEPKGNRADTEIKPFKAFVPNEVAPLKCVQLHKLPEPVIWPRPKEMAHQEGRFAISPNTAIVCAAEGLLPKLARQVQAEISRRFCVDLAIKGEDGTALDSNVIWLGVPQASPKLSEAAQAESLSVPNQAQAYTLKVSAKRVLLAGADIEGAGEGVQALMQWIDHDEQLPFLRNVVVRDWPLLTLRTLAPSADHRQPLFPYKRAESNYYRIINALAHLRFNSVINWDPVTPYQSEAKSRELVHYAGERMVDVRPALWVRDVPGNCIESNPDDQPENRGGIANSDGTWESANLCPSNPASYQAIEQFLDQALRTHDAGRYVEVGYMGCIAGGWNVCRMCRQRNVSGFELYADFVNKIGTLCRARGRTPVFTNGIMLSEAIQKASAGVGAAEAFDSVNRSVGLRFDRTLSAMDILKSGFWTISKPWDTPRAAGQGYQWGGKDFFEGLDGQAGVEGSIVAGEKPDYDWWWSSELSGRVLLTADAFWNGVGRASVPAVSGGQETGGQGRPPHLSPDDYAQLSANACVRMNERVNTGIEYPSWRTGITPKFFSVDIKPFCTRSHIDEGTATGASRSGPKEGVNGFGGAYDLRRIPLGKQVFADVPFEVIDPAQNNWKSMIVVCATRKEALIPGTVSHVEIPVGRQAASLCVLRCYLRTVFRQGDFTQYWNHLTPAYVFEYADGTRCVCDWEVRRHGDDIWTQCFYYGNRMGSSPQSFLLSQCRVAHISNTLSGAGANVFVNEFVNPYPEKEIKRLVLQLPNPEQAQGTYEFHDAVFAVTGVEVTPWDLKYWGRTPAQAGWSALRISRPPLLPANPDIPAESVKVEGVKFGRLERVPVPTYQCNLAKPVTLQALSFRLYVPGRDFGPMAVRNRHGDCKVLVSLDQKTWKEVAARAGCTGMDGEHRLVFAPVEARAVQIIVDPSAYVDEDAADIGLLAADLYGSKP